MAKIEFEEGTIQVGVAVVATGRKIDPAFVQERMLERKITTLCERLIDADVGRHRLTFFSGSRRFRIVVDQDGNLVQSPAVDFGDRGLPASSRRPGA